MNDLHPTILGEEGRPEPFVWVSLPDGSPGHFLAFYDEMGDWTDDRSKAYLVSALDRFVKEWVFPIEANTFEKPRFI